MIFEENEHTLCIVCNHVFVGERPVLLVVKDVGHPPQLLCGGNDHQGREDIHFVGFSSLVEKDTTLRSLMKIEDGETLERRDTNSSWEPSSG